MAEKYELEYIANMVPDASGVRKVMFKPKDNDRITLLKFDNKIREARLVGERIEYDRGKGALCQILDSKANTSMAAMSRNLEHVVVLGRTDSNHLINLTISKAKKKSWLRENIPELGHFWNGVWVGYGEEKCIRGIKVESEASTNLNMSYDGGLIAIACIKGMKIYDTISGRTQTDFGEEELVYLTTAFNWKSNLLAIAVFTPEKKYELRFYKAHENKIMVGGEWVKETNFLELEKLRTPLEYGVDALEFTSDGRYLITATGDKRSNIKDGG